MLAAKLREMRHGHGEALMPMIDAAMREAGLAATQLDAVAVSVGPGGFTGIRVGLAAARGIALAAGARLVGVTSFAAVATAIAPARAQGAALLVALDSRRADLYVQMFDGNGEPLGEPHSVLPAGLAAWVETQAAAVPLAIAGDAADAALAALSGRPGIAIVPDSSPDARGVLAAAQALLARGEGEDARATGPLYLRPPDVTAPARPRPPRPAASRFRIASLPLYAAEPLALLHRACFPDDPWDAAAMARVLSLAGCFGYLAWEDDAPTGFVLARDLGDECEILSLGVVPARRGRGIGARLLQAGLAEAQRRGIASAVLEVAADNSAARRLYARLGFVQVGYRPRYYRRADGTADALILRLNVVRSMTSA